MRRCVIFKPLCAAPNRFSKFKAEQLWLCRCSEHQTNVSLIDRPRRGQGICHDLSNGSYCHPTCMGLGTSHSLMRVSFAPKGRYTSSGAIMSCTHFSTNASPDHSATKQVQKDRLETEEEATEKADKASSEVSDHGVTPNFPPNASAKVRMPEVTPQQTQGDNKHDQSKAASPFSSVEAPLSRPSKNKATLQQATKSVISSIPGGAFVVMQQQYLIMRLIASRLRAWHTVKKKEAVFDVADGLAKGRRSKRHRNRKKQADQRTTKVSSLKSTESSASSHLDSMPNAAPNDLLNQKEAINYAGTPFFRETSIECSTGKVSVNSEAAIKASSLAKTSQTDFASSEKFNHLGQQSGADTVDTLSSLDMKLLDPLRQSLELRVGGEPTSKNVYKDLNIGATMEGAVERQKAPEAFEGSSQIDSSELLRNYEAVLQLVLASGEIEHDAKRFLDEYRMRCHIKENQHEQALLRLGWTLKDYDAGISADRATQIQPWKRILNKTLDVCDVKGTYIVTAGSLSSLTSIMMASMVHLRMLQVVASLLYFTYNMTRKPPLMSAAYWNLVFVAINILMLLRLFLERRPEIFTEAELDIFERHFLNTGLSPRQFKKLLKLAVWKHASRGEVLIEQGSQVKELIILHNGVLSILMNETEVETLEGGDRNAILGLKTFLTKLDETATAKASTPQNSSVQPSNNCEMRTSTAETVRSSRTLQTPTNASDVVRPILAANDADTMTTVVPKALSTSVKFADSSAAEDTSSVLNLRGEEQSQAPNANAVPPSLTSVVVAKDALLLVWPMDEVVKRVKSDPVNLGFPLVGGMARSLVARSRSQSLKQSLTSYEAVMKAVLADGEVRSEEKRFLRECRQKFNVPEEQHWLLIERLGWTREEFEDGAKKSVILQPASRAIRAIVASIKDQIGMSSSPEQPSVVQ